VVLSAACDGTKKKKKKGNQKKKKKKTKKKKDVLSCVYFLSCKATELE
jgi:hypothetical protein